MCSVSVIDFFIEWSKPDDYVGKRVLEVGSKYVNGSVRPLIERFFRPKEYIGVDTEPGKCVDLVLQAERLVEHFGEETFDTVITTEMLEHVKDWRRVVNELKIVLKKNGCLFLTTRSPGFPYHAHPVDFWRFTPSDMERIFCDFEIVTLVPDMLEPGVFVQARKPVSWKPADLSSLEVYSMVQPGPSGKTSNVSNSQNLLSGVRWKLFHN